MLGFIFPTVIAGRKNSPEGTRRELQKKRKSKHDVGRKAELRRDAKKVRHEKRLRRPGGQRGTTEGEQRDEGVGSEEGGGDIVPNTPVRGRH